MSSFLSLVVRLVVLPGVFFTTPNYAAPMAAETAAVTSSKAAYLLRTCVVSGGKLGGMGKPVEFVYRHAGQPDRTVIFCCKACINKFDKYPVRFLAKLDAVETAAKAATTK